MTIIAIHGSCLCGAVTFASAPPFQLMVHCHCSRCRKSSGAAHATNLTVAPDQFHWLSGEASIGRFDLAGAKSYGKWFCRQCGCPVPRLVRSGKFFVIPAGSLDSDPPLSPSSHIFWGSRANWSCSSGGLPTHEEYPTAWI